MLRTTQQRRAGTAVTFIDLVRAQPLRVLLGVLAILLALAVVARPVILLRG